MDLKNTHKSKIIEYRLSANIYIAQINNITESTESILKGIDKRFIQFYFCTKGSLTFNFSCGIHKINLHEGKSFLFYYPSLDNPLSLNINAYSKVFIIALSIKKLHKLFAEYEIQNNLLSNLNNEKFYIERDIFPPIKFILNQIEQMKISLQFQNLFLIGKLYELFTIYFSEIDNENKNCPFLDKEIESKHIKEIKDYLTSDFKNPPTIKELSKKFSISEYHLKDGFKNIYGNTIYNYLIDKKLEFALRKLEDKKAKIKDISLEIGYKNPSHFISAFKKKYGLTPKQYIKEFLTNKVNFTS